MAPTGLTFLYDDKFKNATVTAYTAVTTLPASNVINSLVDKVYRSTANSNDEWIKFDCGSAVAINSIALINHNLSTASNNLIIEANATDSWGSPSYTLTTSAYASGVTDCGTKVIVRVIFLAATQTYRWWRIRPQDAGSSNTYVEFGRILGCSCFESSRNRAYGWAHQLVDLSTKKQIGTYSFIDRLSKRNEINFTIEYVSETEKKNFMSMFDIVGKSEDLVVCFDLSTGQKTSDFSFYGQFEDIPTFTNPTLTYHNISTIKFIESTRDDAAPGESAARGLFAGGLIAGTGTYVNTIEYVTIATTGNSADFGDMTVKRYKLAACASTTRGVFAGGYWTEDMFFYLNVLDYVTIASTGNSIDFGDLTRRVAHFASFSSTTHGVFAGGHNSTGKTNVIEYITIATAGNSADFGDLVVSRTYCSGCASETRGIIASGSFDSSLDDDTNSIEYITISSKSNALDFGDLTAAKCAVTSFSSTTRGFFAGGYTSSAINVIEYITIANSGNASNFGDLLTASQEDSSCSSQIRGVIGALCYAAATTNTIEYLTMTSFGDSANFGDLTQEYWEAAACANLGGT